MSDQPPIRPANLAASRGLDRLVALRFVHFLMGNSANIVLAALLGMYTARILGPAQKGILALAQGTISILAVAAGAGAPHAAGYFARARPNALRTVRRYVQWHVVVGIALVLALLLVASDAATRWFLDGHSVDGLFWVILCLSLLLSIVNSPQLAILSALGDARRVAISSNVSTLTTLVATLVLLQLLDSPLHAAMSAIAAGQGVAVVLLRTRNENSVPTAEPLPYWQFCKFGLKAYIGALAWLAFRRLDLFVVGYFLDARAVGLYAVALSLRELSLTVCRATSLVINGELADPAARASGFAWRTLKRALMLNVVFSLCIILGAFSLLPTLLPLLYGHAYAPAIAPSQIILVSTLPLSLVVPIAAATVAAGRPMRVSVAHVISGVLGLTAAWVLSREYGLMGAAWATVAACFASLVLYVALLVFGGLPARAPKERHDASSTDTEPAESEPVVR